MEGQACERLHKNFLPWHRDDDVLAFSNYDLNLDGSPTHRKKDLNGDGCVHDADPKNCPIPENVYSRFDFNGDGICCKNHQRLRVVPARPLRYNQKPAL